MTPAGRMRGLRLISRTSYGPVGSGQVVVHRGYAYLAPMKDVGTTIVDVRRPVSPRVVARLPLPANTHAHKVQVAGDLMGVNHERLPGYTGADFSAGIEIYDIRDPANPRRLSFFGSGGPGVHRFWFVDGRYAHLSAGADGFTDQIYRIVDLARPDRPEELGRWWIPGQWTAQWGTAGLALLLARTGPWRALRRRRSLLRRLCRLGLGHPGHGRLDASGPPHAVHLSPALRGYAAHRSSVAGAAAGDLHTGGAAGARGGTGPREVPLDRGRSGGSAAHPGGDLPRGARWPGPPGVPVRPTQYPREPPGRACAGGPNLLDVLRGRLARRGHPGSAAPAGGGLVRA